VKREKKEGRASGACWSFSQNWSFLERAVLLSHLSLCHQMELLQGRRCPGEVLRSHKMRQLLLPTSNLGMFEECSAALSLDL